MTATELTALSRLLAAAKIVSAGTNNVTDQEWWGYAVADYRALDATIVAAEKLSALTPVIPAENSK